MKKSLISVFSICLGLTAFSLLAVAQDETITAAGSRYVISNKAGGVNYVEGAVSVVRKTGTSGRLIKGDTLDIADRVSTGADGKAEVLLNPGSFLRLGGNSSFQFKTTSLENLELRLDSGSAILEIFATEDFTVAVGTPKGRYVLTQTGVYRIDVLGADSSRLEVWKGEAEVGGGELVKAGRVAVRTADGYTVSKFDRDEKDALDTWSRLRGKELAKVTARLKDRTVRTALMRSFLGRGWSLFGSFGLWVFDPFYGGYVFLPFGRGWNSPYGYGYACHLGWYNLPPVVWYPPPPTTSGGGTPTTPTITPVLTAGTRDPIPPFVRLEQTMGGGRGGYVDAGGGSTYNPSSSSSSSSSSSTQTYSPPPSPPSSLGSGKVDSPPTKQP